LQVWSTETETATAIKTGIEADTPLRGIKDLGEGHVIEALLFGAGLLGYFKVDAKPIQDCTHMDTLHGLRAWEAEDRDCAQLVPTSFNTRTVAQITEGAALRQETQQVCAMDEHRLISLLLCCFSHTPFS
jgi:hypothetical protein